MPSPGAEDRLRRGAVYLLLACAFVPFVYWTGVLYPAATTRAVVFRVLVQLAGLCLLLLLTLRGRQARFRSDPFLWCFTVFVGVSLLTSLTGLDPGRSLFGTMERMWGVITWVFLLLFYYLLRALLKEEEWMKLFRIFLAVSVAVCLAGIAGTYAEVLHLPDFIGRERRILATLGNPGFVAIYTFLHFALAIWLWGRVRTRGWKIFCLLAGALNVWAYLLTGTRAIIVAAAGSAAVLMLIVLGVLFVRRLGSGRKPMPAVSTRRAGLAIAGVLIVATAAFSLPSFFADLDDVPGAKAVRGYFMDGSARVRLVAWDAAVDSFRERPFLGAGPENFGEAYDRHFDPKSYREIPNNKHYDRVHNVYLEVLTASGLPGLLAYLGIWAALFLGLYRGWKAGRFGIREMLILAWALLGYAIYLFFWFEDHSSTILFVALAAYIWHRAEGEPLVEFERSLPLPRSSRSPLWGLMLFVVLPVAALATHHQGAQVLKAAHLARSAETASDPWLALDRYRGALEAGVRQDEEIAAELYRHLTGLSGWMAVRAKDPAAARKVDSALSFGVAALDREIEEDPENFLLRIRRSQLERISYRIFSRESDFRAAEADLHQALESSPRRIRLHHLLAELYLMKGDHQAALGILDQASVVYDRFGETDLYRAKVRFAMGEREEAFREIRRAFSKAYEGAHSQFILTVGEWLEADARFGEAAGLYRSYLALKYPRLHPFESARELRLFYALPDQRIVFRLPLVELRSGESERAIRTATHLLRQLPREHPASEARAAALRRFIADVERERGDRWSEKMWIGPELRAG